MRQYYEYTTTTYLLITVISLFLSGCANKDLYLASYSRVGIDGSTNGAGIGAKSGYIKVSPTKPDGSPYTVLGSSDIDVSITNVIIEEVLATGMAAICAANKKTDPALVAPTDKINAFILEKMEDRSISVTQGKSPTLIFGSYSSWSLIDLSWAEASSQGINFGYKRSTGLKIPTPSGSEDIASVYAKVTVNTTSDKGQYTTRINGIRNTHTFATGAAAIIKASRNANILSGLAASNQSGLGCLN